MSEKVTLSAQDRKRSLQQAGAGAALFGAGAGGAHLLGERLKRHGAPGTYRATYRTLTRAAKPGLSAHVHIPHVGGKLLTGAAQGVGLPLAAYGVVNALRAKPHQTKALDVHADLVRPVLHQATLQDKVEAGRRAVGKATNLAKALTEDEKRKLGRHRSIGRTTALVGGTLGLGALGTRVPEAARLLARRVPAAARIARHEPAATKLSNTLGVGAIGTGAAGSFNYAAQQKLERKREPVLKADRRDRSASGAAIAGAGATTAGIGLVGGGVPGVKGSSDILERNIHARGVRGAAAHVAAARGGIFGSRSVTHAGYHRQFSEDERYFRAKPATKAQMYERGKTAGKIEPEARVIRHLKGGRAGSVAALAGGAALTAYGVHRARTPGKVRKDERESKRYFGTLAGAGATLAGASEVGSRVLGHQARRWGEEYARTTRASRQLVPNPKSMARKVTRATAYESGHLRGAAGQAQHFAREYGASAAGVKAIRNPALAVAGLGVAGLAATKARHRKVAKRDDRFLRGYSTRISPEAERGYRTLKTGRNEQAAQAVGAGTMAGLGGWLTHHEIKSSGKLAGPAAAIAAAGTVGSGINALQNARGAARYQGKIGRIKAKARSRRAQGLYGPGRGLSPVDTSSANARRHA